MKATVRSCKHILHDMDKGEAKVQFGRSFDPKDNRTVPLQYNMQSSMSPSILYKSIATSKSTWCVNR